MENLLFIYAYILNIKNNFLNPIASSSGIAQAEVVAGIISSVLFGCDKGAALSLCQLLHGKGIIFSWTIIHDDDFQFPPPSCRFKSETHFVQSALEL